MAHIKVLLNTESGEVEIVTSKKIEDTLDEVVEGLEDLGFSEDAAHVYIANSIVDFLDDFEKEISTETEEYEDEDDEDDVLFVTKYTAEAEDIVKALESILEEAEDNMDDDDDDEDEE
jgi:hypothetical protein